MVLCSPYSPFFSSSATVHYIQSRRKCQGLRSIHGQRLTALRIIRASVELLTSISPALGFRGSGDGFRRQSTSLLSLLFLVAPGFLRGNVRFSLCYESIAVSLHAFAVFGNSIMNCREHTQDRTLLPFVVTPAPRSHPWAGELHALSHLGRDAPGTAAETAAVRRAQAPQSMWSRSFCLCRC